MQELKTGLAEKDVKSNGQPMPPGSDRFKSFGHDELTANLCYFRCSRPPDVDGIKIFTHLISHLFWQGLF